ncbi:MAG: Na+/H+ antiporter [Bacteroidota bacterium]
MQHQFIQYVYLILAIVALVMVANKLRLATPIVLVIGGLLLSLISSFATIGIDPEMIFFIFLPPLLYESAWQVSWKQFWKFRRVIASFAFPIVILTSCVVAYVSVALIPGFTLAMGFLLGGIISPPDAISSTTIMKQANASKSLIGLTEGESLLNDASSLIVFRFAIAAILTGQFHLQEASLSFVMVVVFGIAIGVLVGFVFYAIHKWLAVTSDIDIVLTLLTPYCMYYIAEYFHCSGVLSVVSGGLLLSNKRQSMLSYASRIQSVNVWNNIVFVMNGLVFLLIGLQLPSIMQQLGDTTLLSAIGYGLIISTVLIVTRIICTVGASYFTMFMSNFITVADANPGWKMPLIYGWAGIRGVVSLAAALSIPLLMNDGQPFPHRNLILFITFIVILVTLVGQGLTLPWFIRKFSEESRLPKIPSRRQELIIQKKMAHAVIKHLEEKYNEVWAQNELLHGLHSRLNMELRILSKELEVEDYPEEHELLNNYQQIYLEVLEQQRSLLSEMNHMEEFEEDLIRKYLSLIDMEEFKTREKLLKEAE